MKSALNLSFLQFIITAVDMAPTYDRSVAKRRLAILIGNRGGGHKRDDCMSHVTKSRQLGVAVWLYSCQAASHGKNEEMTSDLAGARHCKAFSHLGSTERVSEPGKRVPALPRLAFPDVIRWICQLMMLEHHLAGLGLARPRSP